MGASLFNYSVSGPAVHRHIVYAVCAPCVNIVWNMTSMRVFAVLERTVALVYRRLPVGHGPSPDLEALL